MGYNLKSMEDFLKKNPPDHPLIKPEQYPQSDQDRESVKRKFNNPDEAVLCPRCGKPLGYKSIGNSSAVECPKVGCLYSAIRGI